MKSIISLLKTKEVLLCGKVLSPKEYTLEVGEEGVFFSADEAEYIRLTFDLSLVADSTVMGDAFERTYGDICFRPKTDVIGKILPWYLMAKAGDRFLCLGVSVRPNALCYWQVYENEIVLTYNICAGADPVKLGGRRLSLGKIVLLEETGDFCTVGRKFCSMMCRDGIFPKERVYGANNWYYAYGKSSEREILDDADYLCELTGGIANRPYLVIDDCWEKNECAGPWDELNEAFPDMKNLAGKIKAKGLRPGIWLRPLFYIGDYPTGWILRKEEPGVMLDPTVPEARSFILSNFSRMKEWGYELVKYDYFFYDLIGCFAFDYDPEHGCGICHFADRSKTTAEVMTELMRDIKKTVGQEVILIGCNTPSHLSAGLVEVSRTGDDTSGKDFERTKQMGINTLCYRLIQDGIFYSCDADCVGYTDAVPKEKNAIWLTLLSKSNTPLFLSSRRGVAGKDEIAFFAKCFRENNKKHDFQPILQTNVCIPSEYSIDGEKFSFDI